MSDTPRTDNACGWPFGQHGLIESTILSKNAAGPFVHASVARELERDNNALRAELEAQAVVNGKGSEREAKLLAEVAALRKALEEAFAESDDTVRFHIIRNAVEALKEAQP